MGEFVSISYDSLLNPIAFNVNVAILDKLTNQSAVDTIYGGMMHEDERTYRRKTGTVQSCKTLFAEASGGDVILIKLKESVAESMNVLIQMDDRSGETIEIEMNDIVLPDVSDDALPYFDNDAMAKYLLLTEYVDLLKQWLMNDSVDEYLNVSPIYKQKFEKFMQRMNEYTDAEDNNIFEQELSVLNKLVYDRESAEAMRHLAQYDNVQQDDADEKDVMD